MAAGIMQCEPKKFLTDSPWGRGIRFSSLAFLGRLYGTAIVHWLNRYCQPFLCALIAREILEGRLLWFISSGIARSVSKMGEGAGSRVRRRSRRHFGNLQAASTPRMITKNVKFW